MNTTPTFLKRLTLLVLYLTILYLGASRSQAQEIQYGNTFDFTQGIEKGPLLDVGSEELAPTGVTFSTDGLHLFIVGASGDEVNRYDLSTAFDLSDGVVLHSTFSVASEDITPLDLAFSADGLIMFVVGASNDRVYQYSMGSAYDIADATFEDSYNVGTEDATPSSLAFNDDGTRMYIGGSTDDEINQYTLSSGFDITSTVTWNGALDVSSELNSPSGIGFNDDGTMLYVLDLSSDDINQYALTTAYDVTGTVSFEGASNPVSSIQLSPSGLFIDPAGKQAFIVDENTREVIQYAVLGNGFTETTLNEGVVTGTILARIASETFSNADGILSGNDYTISNLPEGFSSLARVNASGDELVISLSGRALDHQERHNVSDLQITFEDAAFTGGSAAAVTNAISANTSLGVNFEDNFTISYGDGFDLDKNPVYAGNQLNLSDEAVSSASAFAFSIDGKTLIMVDDGANKVEQLFVSDAFDITGNVVNLGDDNVGTDVLTDIAFSPDGLKMYLLGSDADGIAQWTLDEPYVLRFDDAVFESFFDVSGEETNPQSLAFSRDGSKLFVAGSSGDDITQYTLNVPFDLGEGATPNATTLDISGVEGNVRDIAFNPDGTLLFITGASSDEIFQFSLSNPFDITTGVSGGPSYDVSGFSRNPAGMQFSEDGTVIFLLDATDQILHEIALSAFVFEESSTNDGSLTGSATMTIFGGSFSEAGSSFSEGNQYVMEGIPEGLQPAVEVSADGYTATLSFTGNAERSQELDNVDDLTMTFRNSAFEDAPVADYSNSESASTSYSIDFDDNPVISYGRAFDLVEDPVQEGDLFSVEDEEGQPNGMTFNDDGTKLFIVGQNSDVVTEYNLENPFDITSGVSLGVQALDFSSESNSPNAIHFSPDGTKMYVMGFLQRIYQYDLSTPFSISTASNEQQLLIASEETLPNGLEFSNDGRKLFVVGSSGDEVNQYSLTIPFDVTSASFDGTPFSVASQDVSPVDIAFNQTGNKMFIIGNQNDQIYQYSLEVPFETTSGVTYDNISFDFDVDVAPSAFEFNDQGNRLFILGKNQKSISQFTTVGSFEEVVANDGSVEGSATIAIAGDTFTNAGGTLSEGADYTINNLPDGLTSSFQVAADGTSGVLTLSGNATSGLSRDGVESLLFTFSNSAFTNSDAAIVVNAIDAESSIGISFEDNPVLTYGKFFDFEDGAMFLGDDLNLINDEDDPKGLTFNNDGTRLYVVGRNSNVVTEYILSTPYVTTEGITPGNQALDFSGEPNAPEAIKFSPDGSKMFILGFLQRIYQYSLATPFDITTASGIEAQLLIGSQESAPSGFTFSSDGKKLFIVGFVGDDVNQYTLTNPYDISTASFDGNEFDLSPQDNTIMDISFNKTGDKMFILGSQNDQIYQYSLENPFDITSGVTYDDITYLSLFERNVSDFEFDETGEKFYIIGSSTRRVNEYKLLVGGFEEDENNAGEVEGSLSIRITDDTFTNSDGTLTEGTDYTINNLPAGLIPTLAVSSDGTMADLSLSGANPSHQAADDVNSLQFTFFSSAFVGGEASQVIGAQNGESEIGIRFQDNIARLFYGERFNISNGASFVTSVDVSSQSVDPYDVVFNDDGTRFYIADRNRTLYQYSVEEAYDLSSTVEYEGNASVSSAGNNIEGMTFNKDGSKVYALSRSTRDVVQYRLNVPFDITRGSTEEGKLNVQDQTTSPENLFFNEDGTRLFVTTFSVFVQYELSTPYDLTGTVTFVNIHSANFFQEDFLITDFVFSEDGTKLLGLGTQNDSIYQYSLTEAFNPAAGVTYDQVAFDISTLETEPSGLFLSKDFDRLFFTGFNNDEVHQFDLLPARFEEAASNDGSVDGNLSISIFEDTFTNANGTLTEGTDYSITGIPEGLEPSISVSADGSTATLTLGGIATSSNDVDDISSLEFTFDNSAFTSGDASEVVGAVEEAVAIVIDFENGGNSPPTVANAISDQSLEEGFGTTDIDLTDVFSDADGDELTFSASSNDTGVVTVGTSGNTLTITEVGTGTATITVTADDGNGGTVEDVFEVAVNAAANNPPTVANAISDQSLEEGFGTTDIDLTDVFSDADGDELTFSASSNDTGVVTVGTSGNTLTITEVGTGTATITVTADDGNGGTVEDVFEVAVNAAANNPPTVANAISDQSLEEGFGTTDIDLTDVFSDADGDELTFSASSNDTGVVTVGTSGNTLTITEVGTGTATITVTADDGNGGTVEDVFEVAVNAAANNPPTVANAISDQSLEEGFGTTDIDLTDVFSDADGDELTFSASSNDTGVVTVGTSGNTLTITEVGTGTATITVTADDGNGGTIEDVFDVTVNAAANNPPTVANAISDQSLEEGFGTTNIDLTDVFADADGDELTFNASSDDTDVVTVGTSGNTLTITEVGTGTATITVTADDGNGGTVEDVFDVTVNAATNNPPTVANAISDQSLEEGFGTSTIDLTDVFIDADGDDLTFSASSDDTGVVTVGTSGNTLTITEVGTGTATITVTADDGNGGTVEDAFEVAVNAAVNNPPTVANAISDQSLEEGFGTSTIDLTDVFIDADGDDLTFSASSDDTGVVTVGTSGNTLTITEVGTGTATITVTADDGNRGTVEDAFEVAVNAAANNPPTVANAISDQSLEEGFGTTDIDLTDVFTDADGDELTFSASSDDTGVVTVGTSGNTLTITEVGTGTATITVAADDGNGGTVEDVFEAAVNAATNNPPTVANAISDQSLEEGFGTSDIDLTDVFADADGDELTFSASSDDTDVVTVGTSGNTLTITEVGTGTATITVTADDGNGGTVEDVFDVAVDALDNNRPVISSAIAGQTFEEGFGSSTIDLSVVFTDPDGDELAYEVTVDDTEVVTALVSGTDLIITEAGLGNTAVSVTANDGRGGSIANGFNVTVQAAKADQIITFQEIPDKTFTDDAFELVATSDAGLPVSFSVVSGPVTLEGSILTITGVGSVEIAANQEGNEDFNPAVEVRRSFSISRAVQTITVTPIEDKESSAEPFDVIAETTSGLPLSYDVTGPASISGSTITLTGSLGTVEVTVSQDGNENFLSAESQVISFEVLEEILGLERDPNIIIYPNPAIESIRVDGLRPASRIYVYSLSGNILFTSDSAELDVNHLSDGTYIIRISDFSGVYHTERLLKN